MMTVTSRFGRAFADWYRRHIDRVDPLWMTPEFDGNSVRVGLRRFAPHLVIALTSYGANVVVEWEGEGWDLLYADDVAPEADGDGNWYCRECPQPARTFPTREALWADHFFEPLANWCEQVLLPADALYLHRYSGCTWATLGTRATAAPVSAVYGVFAEQAAEKD